MGRETLAERLGKNVRDVRTRRGLTQAELAKLSGVPRSTVSHLETGAGNPTLSVLAALSGALRLSLEELLSAPRSGCQFFPKGSLPVLSRGRRGEVTVQKLLPHPIRGMEIDRITLGPGDRLTGTPHHPGTAEYLSAERGTLTLHVAGQRFDLRPGDVAAFPGDRAHSYHNHGRSPAVGFSVVTLAPLASRVGDAEG